jgi:hypothetical protein
VDRFVKCVSSQEGVFYGVFKASEENKIRNFRVAKRKL